MSLWAPGEIPAEDPTRPAAVFEPRAGSLVERALFNNRGLILLLCALVTAVLSVFATRLRINAHFDRMLPVRHPHIANFLRHRDQLPGLANVVRVAAENKTGTVYEARYLERLRQLNDEVFLIAGVDRPYLRSLWTPNTRWMAVTDEGLDGGPVIPDDYDGSPGSLEEVRANVARSGELGRLVAVDARSSVLWVPLLDHDPATGQRLDYGALGRAFEHVRKSYEGQELGIHITGFAKVAGDLIEGLGQMLVFFALAVAVTLLVLWRYAGSLRNALLVVGCSLVAVLWLLGFLAALGRELDPYSILVPFLTFAIGVSHGTQKMNGIVADIRAGASKLAAARRTFRRLFLPGLIGLVAAAAGFAVLMVIAIPVIRDLAVAATMGVAVLVFTNLVMLPILLSYVGVGASGPATSATPGPGPPTSGLVVRGLTAFTRRGPAAVALLGAAVLAVAAFAGSRRLKIGDLGAGAPELRPTSRYNRDNAYFTRVYAASSDILVVMVETPQYRCADFDVLMRSDQLEWALQALPGVRATSSLAGFSKRFAVGMNEGNPKWYEIPRNQDLLNAAAARAPRELTNYECSLLPLFVYLQDHKADTLAHVVAHVEAFAARHDDANHRFVLGAGNAGIAAATNIVVARAHRQMVVLVYAAVLGLCLLTFAAPAFGRRRRQQTPRGWMLGQAALAALCTALPLGLTSLLCEALMVVLGMGVKVATLPVIAVGVGVGVDYALYVLSVQLRGLAQGLSFAEAYTRTLLFTGKVVLLAAVTLSLAVASWAFSPIKFQADMGILLAFMFIWNMLGTLVLVPALGRFLLRPLPALAPTQSV